MKENGRDSRVFARRVVPYALILVLKEESHESDVAKPNRSKTLPGSTRSSATPGLSAVRKTTARRVRAVVLASRGGRGIAFLAEIEARGIAPAQIDLFEVPGSYEIPLHAQILAKTRRYTAIVAAGLVVDGGIYRHEFVADTVIKALMDVQLRTEVPVFSAVLTPQQFHESAAHFDFFRKHFAVKGIEVAEACANTLLSLERLRGQVAAGIV
jgi:6,7-dimethyl-8-ribityllumazine synthase